MKKRQIPLEVIERGLKDSDYDVRTAAMNACNGRSDIPVEVIELGLTDSDYDVRTAAMKACKGRSDIPLEVIERWLKDSDWRVRTAAMNACNGRSDIPVIRTINPPKTVYKKCLGGVIVCAEIPNNAQIRGSYGSKCRTNKAVITDIIGDFYGEKVGISSYDKKTTYYVGDEIEIENFDYSCKECSTGFHFFCTLKEAKEYEY